MKTIRKVKTVFWREKISLNKSIKFNEDICNPVVTCVMCDLEIGHPSILRQTNYECPRCGYRYKD